MRVITPRDVIPGPGRRRPRQPARPAPAALGVPPHAARARSALRPRRHPARAAHQRVALSASAHTAERALTSSGRGERPTLCFVSQDDDAADLSAVLWHGGWPARAQRSACDTLQVIRLTWGGT